MSGTLAKWTDGQAVTTPDLQRGADAAAAADDLVYEALLPMTSLAGVERRVLPLEPEDESGSPQQLVAGVGFGFLYVAPALYEAAEEIPSGSDVLQVVLAGRLRDGFQSTVPLSANPTGVPRTDLLYAVLTRTTTLSETRRVKDLGGLVASTALAVENKPTVAFLIAEGTTSAPAEGVGAYHFPLAQITLPAAYIEGTAITQDMIRQVWQRTFVPQTAVRAVVGSEFGAGVAGVLEPVSAPPDWSRFGAEHRFALVFKHLVDGATAWSLGDRIGRLDWRNRLVRFSLVRAVAHTSAYPAAHAVTAPGASVSETSSWLFTGTANGTIWTSARGFVLAINSGSLRLSKPSGTAADDAAGDNWILLIETTDRLI